MNDALMLSGAIAKIATQAAGGWKIYLDIPESMGPVVRLLIGTENKIVYTVSFNELSLIECTEKRGPGRPRIPD